MKTAITLFLCIAAVIAFGANTNTVTFNLADFTQGVITNRQVQIKPLSTPRAGGAFVLSRDSLIRYSGTNGAFIVTNMQYGTYVCTLLGPYAKTEFRINVPDTNDTFNASDLFTTAADSIETEDGLTIDLE